MMGAFGGTNAAVVSAPRSFIGMYFFGGRMHLKAGRMIRELPFSSSMRCAHQPGTRPTAKSGVKRSVGMPSIL